jgi:MbtH protein
MTSSAETAAEARCVVVVNHEEQYSIWAADLRVPDGWRTTGFAGTRTECLAHVDEVWTDMRPKSIRTTASER